LIAIAEFPQPLLYQNSLIQTYEFWYYKLGHHPGSSPLLSGLNFVVSLERRQTAYFRLMFCVGTAKSKLVFASVTPYFTPNTIVIPDFIRDPWGGGLWVLARASLGRDDNCVLWDGQI
jgi:hypothetical protein